VFKDPNWDFRTLNFDTDVATIDRQDSGNLGATDPNLKDFVAHGGKLILYHGWNDQLIAPRNSVNYYNSVARALGGPATVKDSIRLFMAPGMNHCGGGDGPFSFDGVSAIEQWVEQGKAPDQIIASHLTGGKTDRTRPLCPYPETAKYKGSGSTDEAANFVCAK
jgi:feruloyl esterase